MSTSNTLTKNDLKKVLEKISIGSGGVIDADDMTQAEINNFLEDINAQGKSSEYRKLLWTNPSPTVAFAAQTISLDLSDYDVVQIDAYLTANGMISTRFTAVGFQGEAGGLGSAGDRYTRNVNVTTTGVAFTVGRSNGTESASACIPYKIYGIKYERVAPPQIELPTYSTEEQVIGTWIDGKPIYRKVLTGTRITGGANYTVSNAAANVADMIDVKTMCKWLNGSTTEYRTINFAYNNGSSDSLWYGGLTIDKNTSNTISLRFQVGSNFGSASMTYWHCILEYTKTTD